MIDRRLTPPARSLDLRFLELDMLAHDGVIFAEAELLGLCPGILFRHIEKTGVSAADQSDLHGGWLRHNPFLLRIRTKTKSGASRRLSSEAGTCAKAVRESSIFGFFAPSDGIKGNAALTFPAHHPSVGWEKR
jgi:hypothetical protein